MVKRSLFAFLLSLAFTLTACGANQNNATAVEKKYGIQPTQRITFEVTLPARETPIVAQSEIPTPNEFKKNPTPSVETPSILVTECGTQGGRLCHWRLTIKGLHFMREWKSAAYLKV